MIVVFFVCVAYERSNELRYQSHKRVGTKTETRAAQARVVRVKGQTGRRDSLVVTLRPSHHVHSLFWYRIISSEPYDRWRVREGSYMVHSYRRLKLN